MALRTYTVGDKSGVRRLDNLTGPWVDVPLNLNPTGTLINVILRDVMTDPNDSNKVFVVGGRDEPTGALGIYVSTDGGAIWTQPGGDLSSPFYRFDTFWEVWVVDSNTIFAVGDNGFVFKSTDGGLTFNKTLTLPTSDGNSQLGENVYSLHFISPLIGIVGAYDRVYKTIDGGATWNLLNGGGVLTPSNPDEIVGIHLSADEQTIIAQGVAGAHRSTDGGASFTAIFNWVSNQGAHLTWLDDDNLWILNNGGQRQVTTDAGATWTQLNPYFALSPSNKAGHLFSSGIGFFSESFDILNTTDDFVTGTFSETSPYGIEAVWTLDDNPPPEPCGCPEGLTYNPTTEECEGFESTAATVSGTIYNVIDGDTSVSYGWAGANFYSNIDSLPQPIFSTTTDMQDQTNTPVPVQQNVSSPLWGDPPTANANMGPLNEVGVWGEINGSQASDHEWIGFTACIEVPTTKEYFIGLAADNLGRFKINGSLVVEFQGCANTFNFNYWHVFPITLQAGTNVIELEGRNCGGAAAFAAEIYDATLAQLTGMTLQAQLDAVTLFSTQDKVGSTFDTGQASGYQCPQGWALSICDGSYSCVREVRTDFEPCNCYLATDCEDPTITMLVTTESELDLNTTYQFEGSTSCWSVEVSTECEVDAPITTITDSFVDCETCLGLCYILTDCEGNETDLKVTNDFAAFVGQVIQLTRCPEVCWQVSLAPDCDGETEQVTMTNSFIDCVSCLPQPEPEPPLTLRPRTVAPGLNLKACDADYIEKVECTFSELLYQEVVNRRYGLQFCCKGDLNKWMIKHELLQLAMITDESQCIIEGLECCPPDNVTATMNP